MISHAPPEPDDADGGMTDFDRKAPCLADGNKGLFYKYFCTFSRLIFFSSPALKDTLAGKNGLIGLP